MSFNLLQPIPNATTGTAGIIKLATLAQISAGIDYTSAVTPSGLASLGYITSAGLSASYYPLNSNPSGYIGNSQTGNFYPSNNPSGYIGNSQTGNFYPSSNPSGYATQSFVISNYYPLIGNPAGFITASQTGQFYPIINPSGYLNSASANLLYYNINNPLGYATSSGVTGYINSISGQFYPSASNPSGYIGNSQTGNFYPISGNPSGFLTSLPTNPSLYPILNQNTTGIAGFVSGSGIIGKVPTSNLYTSASGYNIVSGVQLDIWAQKVSPSGAVVGTTDTQVLSNKSVDAINGGQLAGFRNKIINGDMLIAQGGTGFAAANGYTLDQWGFVSVSAAVVTVSQAADAPSSNEFQSSLRATLTTADTSISSGDLVTFEHKIEGYNVRDLIGRTFTLSFWVRSPVSGVHCVSFVNSGADRSYVAEYTVAVANTWEFKTITVPGGLITAGTWNWTNGIGINARWSLAGGSTWQTTAGAWASGNFTNTSNQVNCLGTVGNIFAITGIQLEIGIQATPFEHIDYGMSLARCQRYFETLSIPVSVPFLAVAYTINSTPMGYWVFHVPKRATPTITASTSSRMVFPSSIGGAGGAITATYITTDGSQLVATNTISAASAGWIDSFTAAASAQL